MFTKKITRTEFLKMGLLGIASILTLPLLKVFGKRKNVSHKTAGYYKDLAG